MAMGGSIPCTSHVGSDTHRVYGACGVVCVAGDVASPLSHRLMDRVGVGMHGLRFFGTPKAHTIAIWKITKADGILVAVNAILAGRINSKYTITARTRCGGVCGDTQFPGGWVTFV